MKEKHRDVHKDTAAHVPLSMNFVKKKSDRGKNKKHRDARWDTAAHVPLFAVRSILL